MPQHDLILYNGNVITLDQSSRRAEAVGVHDGRITEVGASAEVLQERGPGTRAIDLNGGTVLPGLFDAHPHMDRQGLKARGGIPLEGLDSIADIKDVVARAARETPKGEWIVLMPLGTPPHGYVSRPEELREGRFPTRHDLDDAAPEHPVYIRAPWGWWSRRPFPSVASTKALERAGVTRDTRPPYNTEMVRNERGEPTGVFLERNYAPVLEYTLFRCVPRFSDADRAAGVRMGSAAYGAAGTTAVYEGHGLSPALLHAYRDVHEAGDLTVRTVAPLSVPTASFDDRRVADILRHWANRLSWGGRGDDMLRYEGICLDVGDAAVAQIIGEDYPYEQWAGHFYQSVPHERFVEIGVLAAELGLRVNCLICYDLERVLRAYEEIDKRVSIRDRRWVMIHLIDATREQLRRIKELGVMVTVTPNFMYMASDRFGLDRLRERGVPIREALDMGIPLALSSDNVPYSMLWTMWEALARWDADSQSRLGQSGLGREEALRLTVQTGHALTWNERDRGAIEVARCADLVVLDEDPLACDENRIKDIGVRYTFVGGRQVHGPE
ncbi:MAG: amidohydrolase family protein [Gammaproteobacteria bacterium]|nr:amidohydrolase family protein [Gammaproteobacteria bacterium]NIR82922.1 amidohydrolase family protein [Gammaproteobacteria bacterium]NIR90191.1 amidohydrolase family protein [Gammaproteobacteria bacterium]NIU04068.1 amidohydrolase family protein [Gammaproteobacteria bacterium]NIV51057.1 amidohydrolase family protein [Gammaproteobacteria bacterium]